MTPEQKRIEALEETVGTLAAWLVDAQTGFAVRDYKAIEKLISEAREAAPFPDRESES